MITQVDVAVVGAGAAGIAASRALLDAGLTVQVLEARDRVGGRAHTDHSLGLPADMGAAWLHFAEDNAFTAIARDAGFTVIQREPNWGPNAFVGTRSPTPKERERAAEDWARYQALIAAAADAGRDIAVSDVLPTDDFRRRFDAVMTWAVGVESSAVSTLDLTRYAESAHNWAVAEGLGAVVARSASRLPVTLRAPVTAIRWDDQSVHLDTPKGTVRARAAIVTVPTAVLARGSIAFAPQLPARSVAALEALPLGVVNKVFFRVDEGVLPFADTTQLIGIADSSRTGSYTVRPAGQPVIAGFFGGDLSWDLEQRDELEEFARDDLQRIFGAELVRGIKASLATGWGRDPWARGSYSAARPGQADQRAALADPVAATLYFAGEACSRAYYGTLHGAWLSGREAAARLMAHFDNLGYVARSQP